MNIHIDKWYSWQPRANLPALCTSRQDGAHKQCEWNKPDLQSVPAMARRRLSPLARVVFHVLDQCADKNVQEPVVFSSALGEIQRTQGILSDIGLDQPVSPTAFSLSVHNAIAGQWSLIHDIKAPMVALSPAGGCAVPALLEAAGILQEGVYSAVNIVFYEEDYPPFYAPWLDSPIAPSALALRAVAPELSRPASQRLSLRSIDSPGQKKSPCGPLDLLPLLNGSCSVLEVSAPESRWQLGISSNE